MSHRNPLEALEPRTHLAVDLGPTPPTLPGIHNVGRNIYVNGTVAADFIQIIRAPGTQDNPRTGEIQLTLNNAQPTFYPGDMKRFIIQGDAGNDTIRIDAGLPGSFRPRLIVIRGGEGNDTITGSDRKDKIFGDGGDDLIIGFTGNDQLHGGTGNDRVDGGYGGDRIFGDEGNDTLIGGPGNDKMFGGLGDDTFRNLESDAEREFGATDLLHGGGGNDSADVAPFDRYRLVAGRNQT